MKLLVFFLMILILLGCTKPVFKSDWIDKTAPESFVTRFETSKGSFDILLNKKESPKAVDRYYQLVKHHFFDNGIFYRVDSNFVVQFGISDTIKLNYWRKYKVPDEKVIKGNTKGSISFAISGKETRGTDLFINLKDNSKLDTINYAGVTGFPSFGYVIRGMEVVESIYAGYGDNVFTKFDTLYLNPTHFLEIFPKLDVIQKAYILQTQ